ncbi:multidrug resistance protein 1, 2, 3 [Poronia punctata]|nr:multidrug resistance protein 1, 2, 3 [Poronia punctata]
MSNEEEIFARQLHGLSTSQSQSQPRRARLLDFASPTDKILLIISSVCAGLAGALNPLLTVIYGQFVGYFGEFEAGRISSTGLLQAVSIYAPYYAYLGLAILVLAYVSTVGFYLSGERITRNLRREYLKTILRQNMAMFDHLSAGEVTSCIMTDMALIQEGITSRLALWITALATFVAAFVIAFVRYWKTALILSPLFVVMIAIAYVGGSFIVRYSRQKRNHASIAAGLAEEAISSARHVCAYGMADSLAARYSDRIMEAGKGGIRGQAVAATMAAWGNAMPCFAYAFSFWIGSIYLVKGEVTASAVATTTLVISIGGFAVVRVAPSIQAFASAIASADAALETISRKSPQDPLSDEGSSPERVEGDIEIRNVTFKYPSRPDVTVLKNISFRCPAKQTTAIVGVSGCGKSSILGLIERFYEPVAGSIFLDGCDIQSLNLRWLRRQISLVEQEPVLFDTTILQNIISGLPETGLGEQDLEQQAIQAAIKANAHGFITALPHGYHTKVGEKGHQLSGGQRQRIAIARALIRQPKVLLLDEATSALDASSESLVQKALDGTAEDRTTIVIAHRLSTIRRAHNIIVMSEGSVCEQGTHEELLSLGGVYADMVERQQILDMDGSNVGKGAKDGSDLAFESTQHASQDVPSKEKSENSGLDVGIDQKTKDRKPLGFGQTLRFIARMNREETKWLTTGLLCAVLAGLAVPTQSFLFAKLLTIISLPASQYGQLRSEVNFWAWIFFLLAFLTFFVWLGVGVTFAVATERLSRRVKNRCFHAIMRQDMSFFDEQCNTSGRLGGLLSSSTEHLVGLSGPIIGGILTFVATISAGLALALAIGWKLGLICAAFIPVVVATGWIRLQMLTIVDAKVKESGKDGASYAGELVRSMRTVASLGLEPHALFRYDTFLTSHSKASLKTILYASAFYAVSQALVLFVAALVFWYGGELIAGKEYTVFQYYLCFVTLISGTQIAAAMFNYVPEASSAMHAARDIKDILERKPLIVGGSEMTNIVKSAVSKEQEMVEGIEVHLQGVSIQYPSRPDAFSLQGLNLEAHPGQTIALVGSSGCGKSTILSLIERFYDPSAGSVRVGGRSIKDYDLGQYRAIISLVSQDPFLFRGTLRENVAMGLPGKQVPDDEILEACKQSNLADFLSSLPNGLDTDVGPFGNMLSGGQKQRVAIARAMLRQPRILLLDEPTAALDVSSESTVQDALNKVAVNRTTFIAAHRLRTIQHADMIYVLESGEVVEKGRHAELMEKGGLYRRLVQLQDLS